MKENIIKKYLYFFDSINLFTRILKSKLIEKIYFNFNKFKINSIEL